MYSMVHVTLVRSGRRDVLTGNKSEKVSNVQKTKAKATDETRKKG